MGGGYIQLSAVGEQNAYLTGNPQITFFKSIYRRHTNFSIDLCKQVINGEATFNEKFNVIISRYGDLLSNIYVDNVFELKTTAHLKHYKDTGNEPEFKDTYISWTNGIGYAILKEYSVNIGQNTIDTQNGEWLDIYNKLSENQDNNNPSLSYRQLIETDNNNIQTLNEKLLSKGNIDSLSGAIIASLHHGTNYIKTRTITPLKFWFCKYYGLAIPLISLNTLNVTINFEYRKLNELINTNFENDKLKNKHLEGTTVTTSIWGEYIFLDSDERRNFNTNVHEYLIEQVQYIANTMLPIQINGNVQINLKNFTNCVKALFWVPHMIEYTNVCSKKNSYNNIRYAEKRYPKYHSIDKAKSFGNNWFNYSIYSQTNNDTINTDNIYLFKCGQLMLNNEQRTPQLPAMYFANTQPIRYFNNVPFSNYIYTYSFAIYPFEHQPSGTCNFSRFDTITLNLDNLNCNNNNIDNKYEEYGNKSNYLNLYALSYNILLIHSGTAQLKYL